MERVLINMNTPSGPTPSTSSSAYVYRSSPSSQSEIARDLARSRLEAVNLTLLTALGELQSLHPSQQLNPEQFLDLLIVTNDAHRYVDSLYAYLSERTWAAADARAQTPSQESI